MYRAGFFPADLVGSAAISAIDIALWDIKGKALGQPIYNLLGGLVREKVVCYPHNEGGSDPSLSLKENIGLLQYHHVLLCALKLSNF